MLMVVDTSFIDHPTLSIRFIHLRCQYNCNGMPSSLFELPELQLTALFLGC